MDVADVIARARVAQAAIDRWTAEQVEDLTTAVAYAVARKDRAEELARMAVDEAGFGNYADKVTKIQRRVLGVLSDLRATPTVGVVDTDPERGTVTIAKPVGVVAGLIPTTGPDATPPTKALCALAGRNAVVFAAHPRSKRTTDTVVAYMREACEQVGAPADLVQSLPEAKIAHTQELMRQADLIVATGGAGMVKAAYSSGTPAFGVGVGNCVHVVDETADLTDAADAIAIAKTFDHATSCLADNAVVAHADVYDELLGLLRDRGGHLCNAAEKEQLRAAMWPDGGHIPSIDVIAKPATRIAELAGFGVPDGTTFLVVAEDGVGPDHPFSGEKLSVVLALYRYEGGIEAAVDAGQRDHRVPGPRPHLRHPHALRRACRRAGGRHPHRPRAREPQPQRGRRKPALRPAVHALARLRHLGRHDHHREHRRPALRQPDAGGPADPAAHHGRGDALRATLRTLWPLTRSRWGCRA